MIGIDTNKEVIRSWSGTKLRLVTESLIIGVNTVGVAVQVAAKPMGYLGEIYFKFGKYIPYIIVGSIIVLLSTL